MFTFAERSSIKPVAWDEFSIWVVVRDCRNKPWAWEWGLRRVLGHFFKVTHLRVEAMLLPLCPCLLCTWTLVTPWIPHVRMLCKRQVRGGQLTRVHMHLWVVLSSGVAQLLSAKCCHFHLGILRNSAVAFRVSRNDQAQVSMSQRSKEAVLYLPLYGETKIMIPLWTQPHIIYNMLAFLCLGLSQSLAQSMRHAFLKSVHGVSEHLRPFVKTCTRPAWQLLSLDFILKHLNGHSFSALLPVEFYCNSRLRSHEQQMCCLNKKVWMSIPCWKEGDALLSATDAETKWNQSDI